MTQVKKALGRGLSALLGDDFEAIDVKEEFKAKEFQIDMNLIEVNPYQPRLTFAKEELEKLSASIKEYGVIQPVLVRRNGSQYQLVAGERRLQASKLAGMQTIPAVVRDIDDKTMAEVAIIENIQRSDLSPIEEAKAYTKLIEKYSYTQGQLADAMGKSRSYISNTVRLLQLSDTIIDMLDKGDLTTGHAKVLAGHENVDNLARCVVMDALSVRELEKLVRKQARRAKRRNAPRKKRYVAEDGNPTFQAAMAPGEGFGTGEEYPRSELDELSLMLSKAVGAPVEVTDTRFGGHVTISLCGDLKILDKVVSRLSQDDDQNF